MTSLYIHIPFCLRKCLFCSFVVSISQEHRMDAYLDSLAWEAGRYKGTSIKTIYIGGGTPTHLNNQQLKRLVGIVKDNFRYPPETEFTIEANPASFDLEKAKLLFDLGVNRVSLGIQSLHDRYLKYLGRGHTSKDSRGAFDILRTAGFSNINLDLMYSFPRETFHEIEEDALKVAAFGSEHLSLYMLTIEEGSRFYKMNVSLEEDTVQASQYMLVKEILQDSGFEQYEISNFCRPQKESRHNLSYWQADNYIGLGVGAHSHIDGKRFWNVPNLSTYLAKIREGAMPVAGEENLKGHERLMEALLFGLRMLKGVAVETLESKYACRLAQEKKEMINEFIDGGFLKKDQNQIRVTSKGCLVLDELCARLI